MGLSPCKLLCFGLCPLPAADVAVSNWCSRTQGCPGELLSLWKWGNTLPEGPPSLLPFTGGLDLAIEGPSKAEISCIDNKDGTCTVTYLPTLPGDYSILVKYNDKHIPGSPFTAKITGRVTWLVGASQWHVWLSQQPLSQWDQGSRLGIYLSLGFTETLEGGTGGARPTLDGLNSSLGW